MGKKSLPAHAVGYGHAAAGLCDGSQPRYEKRRIRKMRKSIVDHHGIEKHTKIIGLHISADDIDCRLPSGLYKLPVDDSRLAAGYFCHLRRDIYRRKQPYVPLQIIREQHPCAAGHVKDIGALADPGVVKYQVYDLIVSLHARVPAGSIFVKKADNFLFFYHIFPLKTAGTLKRRRLMSLHYPSFARTV